VTQLGGILERGHVELYMGRQRIADYPLSDLELAVAYDRASQRAAITGDAGVHVFDHAKPLVKTDKQGAEPRASSSPSPRVIASRSRATRPSVLYVARASRPTLSVNGELDWTSRHSGSSSRGSGPVSWTSIAPCRS
jgi:hypothetical protein